VQGHVSHPWRSAPPAADETGPPNAEGAKDSQTAQQKAIEKFLDSFGVLREIFASSAFGCPYFIS